MRDATGGGRKTVPRSPPPEHPREGAGRPERGQPARRERERRGERGREGREPGVVLFASDSETLLERTLTLYEALITE